MWLFLLLLLLLVSLVDPPAQFWLSVGKSCFDCVNLVAVLC